ncbi:MAG: LTA synthase family protein, partial [Oscillospiraceae bacterium]|nr:LTA synthase family protein [Oscillospiraceae bacterium]
HGPRLSAKCLEQKPAILSADEFRSCRMQLIWHTALLEGLYGKLYDRSLWERLQLRFPENMSLGEDFVTNLRYYSACNGVVFTGQIGHYYNNIEGSDSLTHRYRPDLFETKMQLMEILWTHLHTNHIPNVEEQICFHNYAAGSGLLCVHEALHTNTLTKKQKLKRLGTICKHPLFLNSIPKAKYIPPSYEAYVPAILSGQIKTLMGFAPPKEKQPTRINRALRWGMRTLSPHLSQAASDKLEQWDHSLAVHGIRHTFSRHTENPQTTLSLLPPLLPYFLTAAILLLSLTQLELSCGRQQPLQFPYLLLNMATLLAVRSLFQLLCSRRWLSDFLLTILSTSIASVNYYVIRFKGSPLSFLELRNLGTALDVLGGYSIPITQTVLVILTLGILGIGLSVLQRRLSGKEVLPHYLQKLSLALVILLTLEIGYFGDPPMKPKQTVGWLWREAYEQYGFAPCTVESFLTLFHTIVEPEGYDAAAMDAMEIPPQKSSPNKTPDIILILNESLYDLSLITDLNADTEYLQSFRRKDIYTGYAVVPAYGGGTNSSEYELLTSNSMALLPGVTPFNTLDLTQANSIVSHLSALGYETLGCHSESGENYYRSRGYPALGFDRIYFDTDFNGKTYHHNRYYESDESLYDNLTAWYDEMAESPRFLYLLTIQNHGSWDHNPTSADTVHAASDYGEYDDDVDEYLTGISQSDEAFRQLTEHFANVDRPVIICMVGDHCPNFANRIIDNKHSPEDAQLLYRSTPMLIWANYDLGLQNKNLGTMSLNFVIPTLLELADVSLTPYYQTMLELKTRVPVLTAYGTCVDSNGQELPLEKDLPFIREVQNYFHWEYNNLSEHRRQLLFSPYQ